MNFITIFRKLLNHSYTLKIKTLGMGYHDPCDILIHAMFSVLVQYVERDLASMLLTINKDIKISDYGLSFFEIIIYKLFGIINSEKMGKEYLCFEKSVGVPEQESVAEEIEILYDWWKYKRCDDFIYQNHINNCDDLFSMIFADDKKRVDDIIMMTRLCNIRDHLWT